MHRIWVLIWQLWAWLLFFKVLVVHVISKHMTTLKNIPEQTVEKWEESTHYAGEFSFGLFFFFFHFTAANHHMRQPWTLRTSIVWKCFAPFSWKIEYTYYATNICKSVIQYIVVFNRRLRFILGHYACSVKRKRKKGKRQKFSCL